MATENIAVEYRPLRIGFCVRNGNIQDVATAARWNTLLWGGAHNPIIPVGAPDGLADDLVRIFQVDVLVPVADTPDIKAFTDKYEWARFPMMHHSTSIFGEDSYTRDNYKKGQKVVQVLDVSHLIHKYWEKDFRFAPDNTSNCAVASWKSRDPHKDLLTLLFGSYPKNEKLTYKYETNFKKALKAHEVKVEAGKSIPISLALRLTPIGLTEQEIKSFGGSRRYGGFYVGDPDNFMDLVNFWNIRAADTYLAFLPRKNARRFSPFIRAHISRIKKTKDFGDQKAVVSVWFAGGKIENHEEEHKEVMALIKPFEAKNRAFMMHRVDIHSWNGHNIIPSYNRLNEASCIANIGMKYGKPTVTAQLSDKPTSKRERRVTDQYFVVSLKPSVSVEFPEHTLTLPVLPDLNEWYGRQIAFDAHSVRVVKTWFGQTVGIITDIGRDAIDVSPVSKHELMKKIFERASITAEKSGAGLIAERLIALMGGVSGSARIFKITGVRKFIEQTDPLQHLMKSEIEKKIIDGGSFNNFINEFGLKGTPLTTEHVFEVMVEHNLIQAGVEVRCPKCSLKTWINLKAVDDMYTCEFCQEKSRFVDVVEPVSVVKEGVEVKKIDGTRWYYRLTGLVGKKDKQQGAIPVILTLQHLSNRMHHTFGEAIHSTALALRYEKNGEKKDAETDLVLFDMEHRMGKSDFEVLIGECKTGQAIKREQIESLVEVKKLLEKSGIKCHLVFVKTKGGFSTAEIGHFKRLVTQGIKPLLFTSNELERWWDEYKNFKASRPNFKLPVEHPFTFGDLAENSAYVYTLT